MINLAASEPTDLKLELNVLKRKLEKKALEIGTAQKKLCQRAHMIDMITFKPLALIEKNLKDWVSKGIDGSMQEVRAHYERCRGANQALTDDLQNLGTRATEAMRFCENVREQANVHPPQAFLKSLKETVLPSLNNLVNLPIGQPEKLKDISLHALYKTKYTMHDTFIKYMTDILGKVMSKPAIEAFAKIALKLPDEPGPLVNVD